MFPLSVDYPQNSGSLFEPDEYDHMVPPRRAKRSIIFKHASLARHH
jgi:hypothetical protein